MSKPKINARKKGHAFELAIAKQMREMGFSDCCSSRLESKSLDDAGVDLCHTKPFNIQAKAVEKTINHHAILERMPNDPNYNLVVQKKNRQGVVVSMRWDDFIELLQMLIQEGIIKP